MRLSDAIQKSEGEHLTNEEFSLYTKAHLDFLVVTQIKPSDPVFAVEFDGAFHADTDQARRDVIKNRLCKQAGLPLLRVGAVEVKEFDRFSLLDYMLMRYIAWKKEKNGILNEIRDYVDEIGPEQTRRLAEDSDPSLDPSFLFDLRHPFPATKTVEERLARKYGIANVDVRPSEVRLARFLFQTECLKEEPDQNDGFSMSSRRVLVYSNNNGKVDQEVYRKDLEIAIRVWLPTENDIPSAPIFDVLTEAGLANLERRVSSIWYPDMPGIEAWNITENFTDYLCRRAVEDWAEETMQRDQY